MLLQRKNLRDEAHACRQAMRYSCQSRGYPKAVAKYSVTHAAAAMEIVLAVLQKSERLIWGAASTFAKKRLAA